MAHGRVTARIRDHVAAYALGLLGPEEARAFKEHLREGGPVCEKELGITHETVSLLAFSVPQVTPKPEIRERLVRKLKSLSEPSRSPQVWKAWDSPEVKGVRLIRAGEGGWESTGLEGVMIKRLYVDPAQESVTMLIRMEPGATYPAHRHGGAEQCFVLEGDLSYDMSLRTGDYLCAEADTVHPVSRTEQGCLLLIISSTHDELIT